jgi:hypothetical protein
MFARPAGPGIGALICLGLACAFAAEARAAEWPMIADRAYSIDLHIGAAFASPRAIGMGGAAVAGAEGANGMLANPAGVAVRPRSARGNWDWDFSADTFVPTLQSDYDNDGNPQAPKHAVEVGEAGLLGFFRAWGLGITAASVVYKVDPGDGNPEPVEIEATRLRFLLGRSFLEEALTIGLSVRLANFGAARARAPLFSEFGASAEAGVVVAPRNRAYRFGLRGAPRVNGTDLTTMCDPLNCQGYILPGRAVAAWEVAAGAAYRFGQTPWNAPVAGRFLDERAWVLAADVVVTGPVDDGAGIEAFSQRRLQPSGRRVVASVRAGAEHETFPGRLRLRAGGYWEPARLEQATGRAHVTGGFEVRLFSFHFWGAERRLAISSAVDGARRYLTIALALGFWH